MVKAIRHVWQQCSLPKVMTLSDKDKMCSLLCFQSLSAFSCHSWLQFLTSRPSLPSDSESLVREILKNLQPLVHQEVSRLLALLWSYSPVKIFHHSLALSFWFMFQFQLMGTCIIPMFLSPQFGSLPDLLIPQELVSWLSPESLQSLWP